jgi:hypothetical protein
LEGAFPDNVLALTEAILTSATGKNPGTIEYDSSEEEFDSKTG